MTLLFAHAGHDHTIHMSSSYLILACMIGLIVLVALAWVVWRVQHNNKQQKKR